MGFAPPKVRWVLASGNAGKCRELQSLWPDIALELQSAHGVSECPEPHGTFLENALAKARHASEQTGLPAIADDSGLVVPCLGGAPGVRSARFSPEATDTANLQALLKALLPHRTAGGPNPAAHFVCLLVALRHPQDPDPAVARGVWHGEVLPAPRGEGGFGYDPIFWVPGLGRSAAELAPAEKNRHSHRAVAAAAMARQLA